MTLIDLTHLSPEDAQEEMQRLTKRAKRVPTPRPTVERAAPAQTTRQTAAVVGGPGKQVKSRCHQSGDQQNSAPALLATAGGVAPGIGGSKMQSEYTDTVRAAGDRSILEWPYQVPSSDVVVNVVYDGVPESKARPRFASSGNVYTPAKTRQYETALGWLMKVGVTGRAPDAQRRYALRCIFYRPNRQRIDCDNLLKAVSDAATGVVWKDDSQVVEVIGKLVVASARPRAEILIHYADDPAPRPLCPVCGKEVVTYPSVSSVHCSLECWAATHRSEQTCVECGAQFTVKKWIAERSKGQFCSRRCSSLHHGKTRTLSAGMSTWKCSECGGPVSHSDTKRCRSCVMATAKTPITTAKPRVRATHCPHGHEFTTENTYTRPNGYRFCRQCAMDARRRTVTK